MKLIKSSREKEFKDARNSSFVELFSNIQEIEEYFKEELKRI